MRLLAFLAALALFFGAAVMFVIAFNPDDTPRCDEVIKQGSLVSECFDISKTQETISTILAIPAGLLAIAGGLLGLAVAATGRHGERMKRVAGLAIALTIPILIINQL